MLIGMNEFIFLAQSSRCVLVLPCPEGRAGPAWNRSIVESAVAAGKVLRTNLPVAIIPPRPIATGKFIASARASAPRPSGMAQAVKSLR